MNMSLTPLQLACLKQTMRHGKTNPITGLEITRLIDIKTRDSGKEGADIRSVINALRCKGYPICASGDGYYYARTEAELMAFVYSFQARIDSQQAACDGLKKSADKLDWNYNTPGEIPDPHPQPFTPYRKWKIASSKQPNKFYEVIDIVVGYACDCEAYKYHHKCKHIDKVKKMVKTENKKLFAEKQKPLL